MKVFAPIAFALAFISNSWAESPTPASKPAPSQPPACVASEFRQFDFWLGKWRVTGPKGNQVGTSEISRVSEGCAIREQWTSSIRTRRHQHQLLRCRQPRMAPGLGRRRRHDSPSPRRAESRRHDLERRKQGHQGDSYQSHYLDSAPGRQGKAAMGDFDRQRHELEDLLCWDLRETTLSSAVGRFLD